MNMVAVFAAVAGGLGARLVLGVVTRFLGTHRLRVRLGLDQERSAQQAKGDRWRPTGIRSALVIATVMLATAAALPGVRSALQICAAAAVLVPGLLVMRDRVCKAARHRQLIATLPTFIDVVALCVRGGLPLETALREAAQAHITPAGKYFDRLLKDAEAGTDIPEVLRAGGNRAQTVELRSICRTLSSALLLGVPTAEALRELSSYASRRRRQNAEERIRSLPVRLTLVAMLLLLPPVVVLAVLPTVAAFLQSPW